MSDGRDPAWHYEQHELAGELRKLVDTLPEPQRSLLVMFDVQGARRRDVCARARPQHESSQGVFAPRAAKAARTIGANVMTQRDLNEEWARTQLEAWADGSLDRREPRAHGRCDRGRSAASARGRARRRRASCVARRRRRRCRAGYAAACSRFRRDRPARSGRSSAGVRERRGCRRRRRRRSLAHGRRLRRRSISVPPRCPRSRDRDALLAEERAHHPRTRHECRRHRLARRVRRKPRGARTSRRNRRLRDMKGRSACCSADCSRLPRRERPRLFFVRRDSGARCGADGSRSIWAPR